MNTLKVSIEELRTKDFNEILEITNQLCDEVREFEGATKAELIKLMAEKLLESGYPQMDIRDLLLERMGDRVTRQYLSRCLDDRFKRPARVAAGKAIREAEAQMIQQQTNNGSALVMEPPRPELSDDESDVDDSKYMEKKHDEHEPEQTTEEEYEDGDASAPTAYKSKYSDEYIAQLEKQVMALNGELSYKDSLATIKIVKLDKVTLNRLDNASAAAKTHVVLLVDVRTNQVSQIYTDTEWKKQTIYKKD